MKLTVEYLAHWSSSTSFARGEGGVTACSHRSMLPRLPLWSLMGLCIVLR